jgi:glutamate formiminotransferase
MAQGTCAQVSVNIADVEAVTLATVFRAVGLAAEAEGAGVRGSELIGGITLPQALRALNEAIGAEISVRQVLDAWLPPLCVPEGSSEP